MGTDDFRALPGKRRLVLGVVVGLVLSVPADLLSVMFIGGGHGTLWPACLFGGPACSVLIIQSHMDYWGVFDPEGLFSAFRIVLACLYAGYGVLLAVGRAKGKATRCLIGIVVFHYTGVAACMIAFADDSGKPFLEVARMCWEWAYLATMLILALHAIMIWAAFGRTIRWRQFSLRSLFVLTTVLALAGGLFATMRWWAEYRPPSERRPVEKQRAEGWKTVP